MKTEKEIEELIDSVKIPSDEEVEPDVGSINEFGK